MKSHLKYIVFLLLVLLTFVQCDQEEDYDIENLNHDVIMILGHAGMGDLYKYPNNSLEAVAPVIGIGADGTELDVQITKDSILILYHDDDLDGRTICEGYTSPYDYNWTEIMNCYYNTLSEPIPIYSAEEVFNRLPNLHDLYFSFDCKCPPGLQFDHIYREKLLRAIKRLCDKFDMSGHVFLEGDMALQLKARDLGLTNRGFVIGSTVDDAAANGIFGIGGDLEIDPDTVKYAHSRGIRVMLWGAKTDTGNKMAIELNADILQTDKPIQILMLFNRYNYDYSVP